MKQFKSTLKSVPETMLWPLYSRATEAMRKNTVFNDAKAIDIFNSIDYNFQNNFGKYISPLHAVKSLYVDKEVNKFLLEYPDSIVVSLGEGLETQRFRTIPARSLWVTIDLPESIKFREYFISPDDKHLHISLSALDKNWFALIPKDKPVMFILQGLLMYFTEKEVKTLVQDIVKNFKYGRIVFDTIPEIFSKKSISKEGWELNGNYIVPPMPWGINFNEIVPTMRKWLPQNINIIAYPYLNYNYGFKYWLLKLYIKIPIIKNIISAIVILDFTKNNLNQVENR